MYVYKTIVCFDLWFLYDCAFCFFDKQLCIQEHLLILNQVKWSLINFNVAFLPGGGVLPCYDSVQRFLFFMEKMVCFDVEVSHWAFWWSCCSYLQRGWVLFLCLHIDNLFRIAYQDEPCSMWFLRHQRLFSTSRSYQWKIGLLLSNLKFSFALWMDMVGSGFKFKNLEFKCNVFPFQIVKFFCRCQKTN